MPDRIKLMEEIQKAVTVFAISVAASFCRLIFYKNESFIKTLLTFVGGIVFGTTVGYIVSQTSLSGWSNIFAAVCAIAGKELVRLIIVGGPDFIKKLANKKAGLKNDTDTNTNVE